MSNIGVFGVIVNKNKILLCKRNYGDYYWTLPGGKIEEKEKIFEALKREIREETNQEIIIDKYILTSYDVEKYSIALIYKCKIERKNIMKFDIREISDLKWIDIGDLDKYAISKRQKKWINYSIENNIGVLEI